MRIIAALLPALAVLPALAEDVTLVAEGRAIPIVIPEGADGPLMDSALDLRHYIAELSGTEPELVSDMGYTGGRGLFIGRVEQARAEDLPPEDAGLEAYAIRPRDGSIFFAARTGYGASFAVSGFLQEALGIRWFMPGPLGEYIPEREPGDLVVEVEEKVVVPDFSPRIWSGNHATRSWIDWNRRARVSLTGNLPFRQFQNNVYRIFPPEEYAESHPEYYPLIDGKRRIPPNATERYWRPCESNPEVIDTIADYARAWLDEHPEAFDFSLGMDDIAYMCQCDNCRALDASPESYADRRFCDRHYWFVNRVARELAKTHPDKRVGTLIYNIARELPERIERLEPNVFGYITQCEAEWFREDRQEEDEALTRAWAERCPDLCRYSYWGLGWVTPRYFPHYMADAIRFDHKQGFRGIYVEVYTCWPNTAPMIWAGTQLFWDASLDIDGLLDEFMAKMYGPAADEMADYFEELEETWTEGNPGRRNWGHRNVPTQAASLTWEQSEELLELIGDAEEAAATDALARERISIVRAGLDMGRMLALSVSLSDSLAAAEVNSVASARETLTRALGQLGFIEEREGFIAGLLERDGLVGETFNALINQYGQHAPPDFSVLDSGAVSAIGGAFDWLEANDPNFIDEAAEMLAQAASEAEQGEELELLRVRRAFLHVAREKPDSLLVNGGFEDGRANDGEAEHDWGTEGAPRGWNTWHRRPSETRFAVVRDGAAEGGRCGEIRRADAAVFIQTVPVEADGAYLCRLRARRDPADAPSDVALQIRWQDAAGAWLTNRAGEARASAPFEADGWMPLYVLATPPEGAAQLVFMCSATNQGEADTALFDDAAVWAVP